MATAMKKPNDTTIWDEFVVNNPAPDWVQELRSTSQARFVHNGLPTTRSERYKYTDIPRFEKGRYFPLSKGQLKITGDLHYVQNIDFTNVPDWAKAMLQSEAAGQVHYKDMVLWDANNAWLRDGLVIDIPAKTTDAQVLELDITGIADTSTSPRILIRVGANAEFTIIERQNGEGAYWNNALTQIQLEKGARLKHYRIQDNSTDAIYTQNTHVLIERDAAYEAFTLTTGAGLSRNQIHAELLGENGEVRLDGINLLSGSIHADTTITIDHKAPHCRSDQNYKSILNDKSHGVFQGKVHVYQIAQKTDGYQLANTLLLSSDATMDTKPELEIYADDVKCSHGSTTGQIDTGPLFYLRSRGLSEAQARLLLMQAFLGPALEQITDEAAREMFGEMTLDWLNKQVA
jgi:Fe-S cluster assembly protein SufD